MEHRPAAAVALLSRDQVICESVAFCLFLLCGAELADHSGGVRPWAQRGETPAYPSSRRKGVTKQKTACRRPLGARC